MPLNLITHSFTHKNTQYLLWASYGVSSVNILEKLDCVIMRPTARIKGNMQIHTERREKAGEFPFKNTHSLPWRYIRNATAALEEDDSSDEAISSRGLKQLGNAFLISYITGCWFGKKTLSLEHCCILVFVSYWCIDVYDSHYLSIYRVFIIENNVLASFVSHIYFSNTVKCH